MILTKKFSTLANFQLSFSHLAVWPNWPLKNLSKLAPFALKFATQITPLLNLSLLIHKVDLSIYSCLISKHMSYRSNIHFISI